MYSLVRKWEVIKIKTNNITIYFLLKRGCFLMYFSTDKTFKIMRTYKYLIIKIEKDHSK